MNTTSSWIRVGTLALVLAHWPWNLQAQNLTPAYGYYPDAVRPASSGSAPATAAPPLNKLYIGFDGGAALQQTITLNDTVGDSERVAFDSGARLDVQLGYIFATNWAAELELGLIINPVKHSYTLGTDYMGVDLVQMPVLVNVIYTRPLGRYWSVYAGGGAGGVFSYYQDEFGDTTPSASAFGYQGMAGIKFALNPRWNLGVAYKILGTTEYDVGSGVAYDGFTPTEYKSSGNLTQSILLTCTYKF